jgi:hypothetical protein
MHQISGTFTTLNKFSFAAMFAEPKQTFLLSTQWMNDFSVMGYLAIDSFWTTLVTLSRLLWHKELFPTKDVQVCNIVFGSWVVIKE